MRALVRLRDFMYILDVPVHTFGLARTNIRRAAGCDLVTAAAHAGLSDAMSLSISFRKSSPPQNRQVIVYYHLIEYEVDSFVGELTFKTN